MSTLKEVSQRIAKSSRFKRAILSEEATEADLFSIFVDFGLAVFEATTRDAVRVYGSHRYMNSVDIKQFIKDMPFPDNISFRIR